MSAPDHHHDTASHAHGTVKLYTVFAVILCLITFCEWLIFKKKQDWGIGSNLMVASLLSLSLVKFTMVCGWYMHLRYDKKILTKIFVAAMLVASSIFLVVSLLVN